MKLFSIMIINWRNAADCTHVDKEEGGTVLSDHKEGLKIPRVKKHLMKWFKIPRLHRCSGRVEDSKGERLLQKMLKIHLPYLTIFTLPYYTYLANSTGLYLTLSYLLYLNNLTLLQ